MNNLSNNGILDCVGNNGIIICGLLNNEWWLWNNNEWII